MLVELLWNCGVIIGKRGLDEGYILGAQCAVPFILGNPRIICYNKDFAGNRCPCMPQCGIIPPERQVGISAAEKRRGDTMEIRKCLEADVARTGLFYDGVILWLNAHVNHPRWIHRVYPSERSVRTMAEKGAQYICTDGDAIIGAFALNAEPQGNYRKGRWSQELVDGAYMVLHALAIDPAAQRRGVGSEIVRFCVDRAKSEGYKAVRVDIVPTNAPARRLFEKNGFAYVGDVDLELNIGDIPAFSLYEYNL